MEKSLGQIAFENDLNRDAEEWTELHSYRKEEYESLRFQSETLDDHTPLLSAET